MTLRNNNKKVLIKKINKRTMKKKYDRFHVCRWPGSHFFNRLSQFMLVNSCKLNSAVFFLLSFTRRHTILMMTWLVSRILFYVVAVIFTHKYGHRSTRNPAHDGSIIIVATKTLRLQPNYSKTNEILTWFQHNFVSLFPSISIHNEWFPHQHFACK